MTAQSGVRAECCRWPMLPKEQKAQVSEFLLVPVTSFGGLEIAAVVVILAGAWRINQLSRPM